MILDISESYRQDRCRYFLSRAVVGSKGCLLWQGSTSRGYAMARVNGGIVYVHRFVAESMLSPEERLKTVGLDACHKCDIRHCINYEHIFFGTRAENIADMTAKGRGNKARNENNNSAKLTKEDVIAMRQIYAEGGYSHRQLAAMFNVSNFAVYSILTYKTWANL